MREEVYEISEPKLDYSVRGRKKIFACELCRRLIYCNKYICSVNMKYDLRSYYHRQCYIRYLQIEEEMGLPYNP